MSDTEHTVNSAWKLEVTSEGVKRVRDTSAKTGVKTLPFESKLRGVFVGLAGGAELAGDQFSANAIESKADELAYGWALLAQENERVRVAVRWMLETSAWGEAIVPTMMVGGAIAWHYGLVPDNFGQKLVMISGLMPISREQEMEQRRRAEVELQKRASEEAAAEREAFNTERTQGRKQEPEPTAEQPSVVEVPDAD